MSFYRLLAEGVAHIRGRFYYLQWSVPKVHFPSSKIQVAAYEGKAQAFSSCSVHKPGCLSWIHTRIQKCYDVLIFYKSDSWWFIVFPGSVSLIIKKSEHLRQKASSLGFVRTKEAPSLLVSWGDSLVCWSELFGALKLTRIPSVYLSICHEIHLQELAQMVAG